LSQSLQIVFLGLSITSTWGNGHATTYRGLIKELALLGHTVTFLERDVPWYAENREFTTSPYCKVQLYGSLTELKDRFTSLLKTADVVVVGSYVPEGTAVGAWVTELGLSCPVFYDIDTPVTMANLKGGTCEYLTEELVGQYRLYLSFTGGPMLNFIEQKLGSPRARPLYCSVDPAIYFPESAPRQWDLGYLGTYAADRQPTLNKLFIDVAKNEPERAFVIAGPQYPQDVYWPDNIERIEHVPASEHRRFYNSQRFTLNVTRMDMVAAGYSPSVRVFEAAACGVPILTDSWPGLDHFFTPYEEIIPVNVPSDVASAMRMNDEECQAIAERARARTLKSHTAAVRAREFDGYIREVVEQTARRDFQSKSPALI
jgi:spore maturation protein CgeB